MAKPVVSISKTVFKFHLLDKYLPKFQFSERHECVVQASPKQVFEAIGIWSDTDDVLVRMMVTLREAPSRIAGFLGAKTTLKAQKRFGLHNFTPLEKSEQEVAYGLVGRFWRTTYGLEKVADGQAFLAFDKKSVPKLAMAFATEPLSPSGGGVRLVTETRIYCPDLRSRLSFLPYWLLIRPASGLIRMRILRSIKARAEAIAEKYPEIKS